MLYRLSADGELIRGVTSVTRQSLSYLHGSTEHTAYQSKLSEYLRPAST